MRKNVPDQAPGKVSITPEQANSLAEALCMQVDQSNQARGKLPDRWQRLENLYRIAPGTTRLNVVEGMAGYEIPLMRPKIDRIVGNLYNAITGLSPYVQVLSGDDATQSICDALQRTLQRGCELGGFDQALAGALLPTALLDCGVMRVLPDLETGFKFDYVHPRHLVCYPAEVRTFAEAKTVGHRFLMPRYKVEERIRSGEYRDEKVSGGTVPVEDEAGAPNLDLLRATAPIDVGDENVELYQLIATANLAAPKSAPEYKRYLVTVAKNDRKLLKIDEYAAPVPWYFKLSVLPPPETIWPEDSVGQALQGLQLAYSDGYTLLIQGSMIGAFSVNFLSGGLPNWKAKRISPGAFIEVAEGFKLQQTRTDFNPAAIPAVLEKIEEVADAVSRIAQAGTGEEFHPGTTATEAAGLFAAQQEGKDQYVQAVSPAIADIWKLMFWFLKYHFQTIKDAMGAACSIDSYDQIAALEPAFEVTGKSGSSNPNGAIQKLGMLLQMAQNPMSSLDYRAVEDRIVQSLELPFNASGLMKSPDEIAASAQPQIAQPPVAGPPGVPAVAQPPMQPQGDGPLAVPGGGMLQPPFVHPGGT